MDGVAAIMMREECGDLFGSPPFFLLPPTQSRRRSSKQTWVFMLIKRHHFIPSGSLFLCLSPLVALGEKERMTEEAYPGWGYCVGVVDR